MTREIKFRAWDICHKEMVYEIDDIDFRCQEVYFKQCFVHSFVDEMVLMQFTGLKDKNGKEIYEGDILRNYWTRIDGVDLGNLWKVKFGQYSDAELEYGSSGHIGFYASCLNPGEPEDRQQPLAGLSCDQINNGKGYGDNIEVIGNIYENPELIKKKDAPIR